MTHFYFYFFVCFSHVKSSPFLICFIISHLPYFVNKCFYKIQLISEKNTYGLVKAFIYETGCRIAVNNGISTGDTITEYDFGTMLYEELKDSEMTGFFPYKFEDLKKRLGL